MNELPWSNGQMRKLGKCIQLGEEPTANVPDYGEVMMHYNDVAAWTQEQIKGLDWESLLGGRSFEVTSRPKTIDTLKQKLQRDTTKPLQVIQDIAGVRFEAEMTLDEQDAVVTAIVGLFGHNLEECVKDLRVGDHSGYRAVHIWLRLPTRVEVQVRTHLQSAWANMYESLADVLGRDIRYGVMPTRTALKRAVTTLQNLSTSTIAKMESLNNGLVESEEQFTTMKNWYESLAPDDQAHHREEYLTAQDAYSSLKKLLGDMELELQATLANHKETFDNMRESERS